MTKVELKHVSNKYILRDINLTVEDGELLALLGPSGAGKTTLLNVIAGIIEYEGTVLFDGKSMDGVPASKRGVGYVFQDLVLFPHLTVFSNIAYGLRVKGRPKEEVERRVNELLELMKIEHLKDRYPRDLSGGERQRVALARALAPSPINVLLLDEPFNNLDPYIRRYLRAEFREMQKKLGVTTIFVTHDPEEAREVCDRVAVIINGRIRQVGAPDEVFSNPDGNEVAELVGSQNILYCSNCKPLGHGLFEVECNGMKIVTSYDGDVIKKIVIPAREIYIYPDSPKGSHFNTFKGTILDVARLSPSMVRMKVKVGENTLLAELSADIFNTIGLSVGKEIFLKLKLKSIRAYG